MPCYNSYIEWKSILLKIAKFKITLSKKEKKKKPINNDGRYINITSIKPLVYSLKVQSYQSMDYKILFPQKTNL